MTIEEAIKEINSFRVITVDRKSIKLLDKWNELLLELQQFELTNNEYISLNQELNVQIKRIKKSQLSRKVIKDSLKFTISFLKNTFNIKNSSQYFIIGASIGLLSSFLMSINILFGLIIGMGTGYILDNHFNKKQRSIKTNLNYTK